MRTFISIFLLSCVLTASAQRPQGSVVIALLPQETATLTRLDADVAVALAVYRRTQAAQCDYEFGLRITKYKLVKPRPDDPCRYYKGNAPSRFIGGYSSEPVVEFTYDYKYLIKR